VREGVEVWSDMARDDPSAIIFDRVDYERQIINLRLVQSVWLDTEAQSQIRYSLPMDYSPLLVSESSQPVFNNAVRSDDGRLVIAQPHSSKNDKSNTGTHTFWGRAART